MKVINIILTQISITEFIGFGVTSVTTIKIENIGRHIRSFLLVRYEVTFKSKRLVLQGVEIGFHPNKGRWE